MGWVVCLEASLLDRVHPSSRVSVQHILVGLTYIFKMKGVIDIFRIYKNDLFSVTK